MYGMVVRGHGRAAGWGSSCRPLLTSDDMLSSDSFAAKCAGDVLVLLLCPLSAVADSLAASLPALHVCRLCAVASRL